MKDLADTLDRLAAIDAELDDLYRISAMCEASGRALHPSRAGWIAALEGRRAALAAELS